MIATLSPRWQTDTIEPADYLEFVADDEILVKGTRIGLEQIIDAYEAGATPEEIALNYRALTLEQVYVAITYYLLHKQEITHYLRRLSEAAITAPNTLRTELRQRLAHRFELQGTETRLQIVASES